MKVRKIFINIFKIDFNVYFINNLEIFDIKSSIKRFNEIEMNEIPFYFSCKNCKQVPKIFLSDEKNLFIYCKNVEKKRMKKLKILLIIIRIGFRMK